MNSKKKNKHRQNKPPNPTPPQKIEVTETVSQEEKIEIVEERVPNIVSENVNIVPDVKPEETPKKPKRNKGKNKKDEDKSEKDEDIVPEEPVPVLEIQPAQDEVIDASITPTARKKKNKNKKNKETPKEEIVEEKEVQCEVKLEEKSANEPQVEDIKEETEAESKLSKKKNKKKKNRSDSEQNDKSEKEEVSCTSAFQKLSVADDKSRSEKIATTTDDSSISEATVKEVEILPQTSPSDIKSPEGPSHKDEGNKNKKKNKKDKKQPSSDPSNKEECRPSEITQQQNIEIPSAVTEASNDTKIENTETPVTEETPSTSNTDEKGPKQKAKIAKPVEKKKKEYIEKTEEKVKPVDEVKTTVPSATMPPESVLVESTSISAEVELLPFISLEDEQDEPPITSPDWQEEVKMEEGNGPVIGCEEKLELSPTVQDNNNKRRKKSPKPQRRLGTVISPDIPEQTASLVDIKTETKAEDASTSFSLPAEIKSDEPTTKETEDPISPVPTSPVGEDAMDGDGKSGPNEKKQKGKKSPKPQRKNETSVISSDLFQPDIPKSPVEMKTISEPISSTEHAESKINDAVEKKETKIDDIERVQTPDSEKRHKNKKTQKHQTDSEQASSSKSKGNKNRINIDDIIIIQAEVVSDDKAKQGDTFIACEENIQKEESHKSKKGKKSPKPPKETDFKPSDFSKESETQAEVQMPITPSPADTKLPSSTISVEQISKIDAVPSPSDITPDIIEYPRCSSEQLMDTNNNMVIAEISQTDSKLSVPIVIPDTPFIESTELPTPELISGIKVNETETVKKMDQKTDLKSKVMEVNQDMEELRLSIERSLAELTSLDKMDKEFDKKMDEGEKFSADQASQIKPDPEWFKQENEAEPVKSETLPVTISETPTQTTVEEQIAQEPVCPERKDRKGKGKSKKKGKQDVAASSTTQQASLAASDTKDASKSQETKKDDSKKSDEKSDTKQDTGKQQSSGKNENKDDESNLNSGNTSDFEPIENFEDAMTSSADDVNKSFEIIANEANPRLNPENNPEINIIAPQEDEKEGNDKNKTVTPPKNLLGHPDIPVPSSKTDYKKEKNKAPNNRQAKVKIKDCNQVEFESDKTKQSKESQTENKRKLSKNVNESICVMNKNEDYVYKYSFRKVFLQCTCHVCKKDLCETRVPCSYCNLIFYCSQKHKDEDYAQHQALCFAVSTIVHLKDQKFIYADAQNITGYNYRLLRMQMIVSCEKVLKRRLAPWEQEALLYPRICADAGCREWRQENLKDCDGCGQISYCTDSDHLPKSHSRWCKSYSLYRALVRHQQTRGRLEPKLPTRVVDLGLLPENFNEVLAAMYEERIDMSDIEYAALTQLATAPLTALYCLQAYNKTGSTNGLSKISTLTLHIVGAELQFEADVLNKWEVFLLHLVPSVKELRVVLIGPEMNPSNLPLDLLGKIKLCLNCQQNKRRVIFGFQDKRNYHEFWASDDFTTPDLVCAFNPSIQRCSSYNGKDSWPSTISCILKQKVPFLITSYTLLELNSDLLRIQEFSGVPYNVVFSPKTNSFSSVRPDRNFISDDEAPLLFKNQCVTVLCGV